MTDDVNPDRTRHPIPATRWPTAAEAAAGRWFTPVTLGPITALESTGRMVVAIDQ